MRVDFKKEQRERLEEFISYLGITKHAFCINCGLSATYFYTMRKGFGAKALQRIGQTYPLLNTDWLLTGRGSMVPNEYMDAEKTNKRTYNNANNCGLNVYMLKHSGEFEEEVSNIISMPDSQEGDICVAITDDSMSPKYVPSSIIHIREIGDWKEYLGYGYDFVFILKDGRRIFRRAEKAEHIDNIRCCSYNDNYGNEDVQKRFISKVYKVISCLSFY
ncbi:MAG: hypothetical protein J6Z32_06995 [Bacteroidales bacterium]|nr:hypothetical protein [Bacteroidales bacterium]